MYRLIRSLLFLLPAETAHHLTLDSLNILLGVPFIKSFFVHLFRVENSFEFLNIKFSNRVGVAAGLDKNARHLEALKCLGFGFVEIGTVTPKPQPGNDKPRLFRLKRDEALINRMGFNNDGVDAIAKRLQKRPKNLVVGGNIGKNKVTPNEQAVNDYAICFNKLYECVDYFVVNVSSPNTPGLRELQEKKPLQEILSKLVELRTLQMKKDQMYKPILLKIAPDLTESQIDDVVDIVKSTGIDGIVASNTTLSREGLQADAAAVKAMGSGGLSGKVLSEVSDRIIAYINKRSNGSIPIMGVGGVHDEESALAKIKAGAGVVQIYTAFIYGGPYLVRRIAEAIRKHH